MTMTHQEDYTVQLGTFQGPLDLLLYLIRRAEVDITDIPIAEVTDQYMAFLRTIERIDIELAGDFLVMAATLMEIKSRMLMPPPEEGAEGESGTSGGVTDDINAALNATGDGLDRADPRYDLVRQLLAYKRFRDAAAHLEERQESWANRFPVTGKKPLLRPAAGSAVPDTLFEGSDASRGAAVGGIPGAPGLSADSIAGWDDDDEESDEQTAAAFDAARALAASGQVEQIGAGAEEGGVDADLEDVEIWDLFNIFQQIIEAVDFGRAGPHQVAYDDTPIRLHQEDLLDLMRRSATKQLSLLSVAKGRTRNELIGLFLATLELVRERRVRVVQNRVRDDIVLMPVDPEDEDNETLDESNDAAAPTPAAHDDVRGSFADGSADDSETLDDAEDMTALHHVAEDDEGDDTWLDDASDFDAEDEISG